MLILIVDDDRLVRFTIKSMLQEFLDDSTDMFLEATNGRDMVTICKEKNPDVAFVDISMPYMNGIDAIEECQKYSSMTQYVIVSGYSDFEYARKGIRLGISDYLLKPVDSEKLKEVVERIQLWTREKKQASNSKFQLQIMETFNYFVSLGTEEAEFEDRLADYTTFLLYVKEGSCTRKETLHFQKQIVREIKKLGEEIVARKGHYTITNTGEGAICIIFDVPEKVQDYLMSYIGKICLIFNNKYPFFYYLIKVRCNTLQELYQKSEKIDSRIHLLQDMQPGCVYEEQELERGEAEGEFLLYVEKLLEAWKRADGVECKEAINKVWRKYRDKTLEIRLKYLSEYCSAVCGCPISGESTKQFFYSFVEYSETMYRGSGTEENDMIEQVKQYVQKNYMHDVSVSQIAEMFGLTANYLSTIFKRKTGEKFIDYLTNIRLEASKKLLVKNTSASVQDIALMVGYNSPRHFSALFQKYTGETPSTYRKSRT